MTSPVVVDLPPGSRARGEAHGEALRHLIAEGLDRWRDSIAATGSEPLAWIQEFVAVTRYRSAVERWTPELLDEIAGIAAGAGVDETTMFAFQLVDEQWAYIRRRPEHEHCSVLGFPATPDAPVVIGQNMDLPAWFDGLQAVLRIAGGEHPGAVLSIAAGLVVTNGMNAEGVAVCENTLPDVRSATNGLPVAFVLRGALRSRTLAEAVTFLADVDHASGQHYLVGDPDGLAGVEADADGVTVSADVVAPVCHTNHSLTRPVVAGWTTESAAGALAFSTDRLHFLSHAAPDAARGEVAGMIEVLSDVTVPIRRTPTPTLASSTFATTVFELQRGGPLAHIRGGPGETEFKVIMPR